MSMHEFSQKKSSILNSLLFRNSWHFIPRLGCLCVFLHLRWESIFSAKSIVNFTDYFAWQLVACSVCPPNGRKKCCSHIMRCSCVGSSLCFVTYPLLSYWMACLFPYTSLGFHFHFTLKTLPQNDIKKTQFYKTLQKYYVYFRQLRF